MSEAGPASPPQDWKGKPLKVQRKSVLSSSLPLVLNSPSFSFSNQGNSRSSDGMCEDRGGPLHQSATWANCLSWTHWSSQVWSPDAGKWGQPNPQVFLRLMSGCCPFGSMCMLWHAHTAAPLPIILQLGELLRHGKDARQELQGTSAVTIPFWLSESLLFLPWRTGAS